LRLGIAAGLLTTTAGSIRYRHDLIREAVLDAAIPHAIAAMHRRAAAALGGEDVLARRAEHLASAGDGEEAAVLFAAAAIRELDAHALLDAEHLARRSLEVARYKESTAAGADALAAVLAAQGRWAEALEIDESTVRAAGDTRARRHRMAAAALEAGHPDRARAVLARATDDSALGRVLAARVALVGGDAAAAIAAADDVLAQQVDTETRLSALDIRARALDFLDDRGAAAASWSAMAA
jgi:hypothetical protein